MENKLKKQKSSAQRAKLVRFSGMGVQMICVIVLFVWAGTELDKRSPEGTPWWTVGGSLFGVFAALYLIIKEAQKINS
jgi:F0F1-type ATP synthase assembly protein I